MNVNVHIAVCVTETAKPVLNTTEKEVHVQIAEKPNQRKEQQNLVNREEDLIVVCRKV